MTTVTRFYNFAEHIIDDLGPGTQQSCYVFTIDNLDSHKNHAVQALIINCGHQIVYCAPYYPVDSAIEDIFNLIQYFVRLEL